jgi:hypothetical protein
MCFVYPYSSLFAVTVGRKTSFFDIRCQLASFDHCLVIVLHGDAVKTCYPTEKQILKVPMSTSVYIYSRLFASCCTVYNNKKKTNTQVLTTDGRPTMELISASILSTGSAVDSYFTRLHSINV